MPKPFDLQSPDHPTTRSPDQLLTYSFVIPAFNESVRIGPTLHALLRHVQEENWDAEILVVNDGSSDDTAQIVRDYGKSHPQILLVENPGNRGKGYSVRNGMLHAHGDICLFTDADLSSPITEAEKLFEAIGRVHPQVLGRTLPLNGAGTIGAVLADLGLPLKLLRGFALLARTAGLLGQLAEEQRTPIANDIYMHVDRNAVYLPPKSE